MFQITPDGKRRIVGIFVTRDTKEMVIVYYYINNTKMLYYRFDKEEKCFEDTPGSVVLQLFYNEKDLKSRAKYLFGLKDLETFTPIKDKTATNTLQAKHDALIESTTRKVIRKLFKDCDIPTHKP